MFPAQLSRRDRKSASAKIFRQIPYRLVYHLFDPHATWTVDPEAFHSRGRNTPFAGWRLKGRVIATVLAGRFTHVAEGVQFERPAAALEGAR